MNKLQKESGLASTWMIVAIIAILTTVLVGVALAWAMINYFDQKNNVDTKVATAVSTAKKEQADSDEAKFTEREKDPNREFAGPEDYGQLAFKYPKTWSVYIDKDASSGDTFQAYLNPVTVPPVSSTQQYALRVMIQSKDYEDVIDSYQSQVGRGDLKSSTVKFGKENGTRLDGSFSSDIRGSAVIFKIRDKTVTLRTDANTFKNDFNKLIKTISFND